MRVLTLIFVILIASLQYPLWLGKGSWLRVWDLSRQIAEQKDKNKLLKARNDTLDAEVRDLKQGYAAIEERARSELGMIKQDEVFYQVLQANAPTHFAPPPVDPALKAAEHATGGQQVETKSAAIKPVAKPEVKSDVKPDAKSEAQPAQVKPISEPASRQ